MNAPFLPRPPDLPEMWCGNDFLTTHRPHPWLVGNGNVMVRCPGREAHAAAEKTPRSA